MAKERGPVLDKAGVQKLIRSAIDVGQLDSLYRKQRYSFGEPWESAITDSQRGGVWPIYPSIRVQGLEIGRNRDILVAQSRVLSRMMATTPMPSFPKIQSEIVRDVLRGFWKARAESDYGDATNWKAHIDSWFQDADALGYGAMAIGLEDFDDELQRVTLRHIPACNVIWDPLQRNPLHASWVAWWYFLDPAQAEARYGWGEVKGAVENYTFEDDDARPDQIEAVRVIEFVCRPVMSGRRVVRKGQKAVILKDVDSTPITLKDNEFDCVPIEFMVNLLMPGMQYPIGRVDLQLATNEMQAEVDRYIRDHMRIPTLDLVDTTKAETSELKKFYRQNQHIEAVRTKADLGAQPVTRIPVPPMDASVMILGERLERRKNEERGLTELDMGNQASSDRTKYENQEMQQGSIQNNAWTRYQASLALARLVRKVFKVAHEFDTAPVTVDIGGHNVLINDPGNPDSYIQSFLDIEPIDEVLIDEDSLTVSDDRTRKAMRVAALKVLEPLVGQVYDPVKYAEELLKATIDQPFEDWKYEPPVQETAPPATEQV